MILPYSIPATTLYAATFFIVAMLLLILLRTRLRLRQRRQKHALQEQVQQFFDEWLSQALMGDVSANTAFTIPDLLQPGRRNSFARQYAIGQLINTKKNLIGLAARNIIWLYEQMGLQTDSIAQFRHRKWHKKARGIYELYMMEQAGMQQKINRYTNSRNEHVRMEAQIAVLAFAGFNGLHFLDTLTRPMSHWQQLRLIDQLTPLDPGNFDHLANWLKSPNPDVVVFTLKLTDLYQQLQVREEVIACLQSPNAGIRAHAIRALIRVGNEDTPAVLVKQYRAETTANKPIVLQSLENMATDRELPFLLQLLDNPDPAVKLQGSRIILKCCSNGALLLEQRAHHGAPVHKQIFLHIKNGVTV
ncbi:HEAT repeat domain-containing protein [Chitinophaga agrisoli]|uniref:HEAT repeat domain-containing protein n=1 Tax=Chitinophaga agrisoli TaxID=2607653 RepID=A0A5B2VNC3_9BACT|nr:HEAT repeat domain-containing protein [Chitinophaga agrisoli]KAA2240208.1 HEAT repeat domain-containing protein [Chitinophaga agrisoli]